MKIVLKIENFSYHNLKGIFDKKDLVLLKGGKDLSLVIMDKSDNVSKNQRSEIFL